VSVDFGRFVTEEGVLYRLSVEQLDAVKAKLAYLVG